MRVSGPDGQLFDFEEGTPDEVMGRVIRDHYAAADTSVAADVAKAGASGVATGAVSTALGLPGTVAGATRDAADFLARQTAGRVYNRFAPGGTGDWSADTRTEIPGSGGPNIGPDAMLPTVQSVQERMPQYTPQTNAGMYARSAGEMLGGNLVLPGGTIAQRAVSGIAGGLGSEAAGQAVQGTTLEPYEPYARVAGALIAPGIAGRAITPLRGDPAAAAAARRLEQEGIQVSAGQAKGSEALRTAESQLGQVPLGRQVVPNQQAQFNEAVGRRMGVQGAEALSSDVMAGRATELAQQYDNILSKNTLKTDAQFGQDLSRTMSEYLGRISLQQRPEFERAVNSLASDINRFGGTLPGPLYQQARSHFGDLAFANKQTDPAMAQATRGVRDALDDAMQRSIPDPREAELLRATNRNYRAMKTIEDALSRAGSDALGNLSPNAVLGAATKSAGKAARARGTDDLLNLANTAKTVMRMPPNSGTASRLNIMNLAQGGGLAGHFAGIGGIPGAALGVAGPAMASRFINGPLGQAWLGNSLLNEGVLDGARALANAAQAGSGILGRR